jgi:small subunit ribosomal protein S4
MNPKGRPRNQSDYAIELEKRRNLKQEYGCQKILPREKLEKRLDNIVYRLGFAITRPAARQIVSHRGVVVNGRIVNIPSFMTQPGDTITLRKEKLLPETFKKHKVPSWLKLERKNLTGTVVSEPAVIE